LREDADDSRSAIMTYIMQDIAICQRRGRAQLAPISRSTSHLFLPSFKPMVECNPHLDRVFGSLAEAAIDLGRYRDIWESRLDRLETWLEQQP
jgi:hypothetical protein